MVEIPCPLCWKANEQSGSWGIQNFGTMDFNVTFGSKNSKLFIIWWFVGKFGIWWMLLASSGKTIPDHRAVRIGLSALKCSVEPQIWHTFSLVTQSLKPWLNPPHLVDRFAAVCAEGLMYRRVFLPFVLVDLCFVVPRVTCFLEYLLEGLKLEEDVLLILFVFDSNLFPVWLYSERNLKHPLDSARCSCFCCF